MGSEFNKYIEPFVGSAQLFFASKPNLAVLSDTNQHLIECYLSVKNYPDEVFSYLKEFPIGKESYYHIRKQNTKGWDSNKRAARFMYLNTFCFNGLYRTNKSGEFNVPFSVDSSQIISYERLIQVSNDLQSADFYVGDFEKIVGDNCKKNDFVYLDPPYAVRNKDIFLQYGPDTFGLSDLNRLECCIGAINEMGATFLMSYAMCDEAKLIAKDWYSTTISTVRNISGFAKHRKTEIEILISNKPFND
jgi:DNA adenine methylase